jgi:cytochrome P450
VAPAFGLSFLRTLEPIMHECIRVLLRKMDQVLKDQTHQLQQHAESKIPAVNVCSFMNRLSLDIIGETAFGQTFGMVLHDDHPIPKLMADSLKRSSQQVFNPILRWLIPVDNSFFKFGSERVEARKVAMRLQQQQQQEQDDETVVAQYGKRSDLLQYLIDAQERERANGQGETGNAYEDMISGKLTDKALETETVLFL